MKYLLDLIQRSSTSSSPTPGLSIPTSVTNGIHLSTSGAPISSINVTANGITSTSPSVSGVVAGDGKKKSMSSYGLFGALGSKEGEELKKVAMEAMAGTGANGSDRSHVLAQLARQKAWLEFYQHCERIVQTLRDHELAGPFLTKVKKSEAPDYYHVIAQPIDLGQILKRIQNSLNSLHSYAAALNDPNSSEHHHHHHPRKNQAHSRSGNDGNSVPGGGYWFSGGGGWGTVSSNGQAGPTGGGGGGSSGGWPRDGANGHGHSGGGGNTAGPVWGTGGVNGGPNLYYKSKKAFVDELEMVWQNCLTYNSVPSHPLRQSAYTLQAKSRELCKWLPDPSSNPTTAVVGHGAGGVATRGRVTFTSARGRSRGGSAAASGSVVSSSGAGPTTSQPQQQPSNSTGTAAPKFKFVSSLPPGPRPSGRQTDSTAADTKSEGEIGNTSSSEVRRKRKRVTTVIDSDDEEEEKEQAVIKKLKGPQGEAIPSFSSNAPQSSQTHTQISGHPPTPEDSPPAPTNASQTVPAPAPALSPPSVSRSRLSPPPVIDTSLFPYWSSVEKRNDNLAAFGRLDQLVRNWHARPQDQASTPSQAAASTFGANNLLNPPPPLMQLDLLNPPPPPANILQPPPPPVSSSTMNIFHPPPPPPYSSTQNDTHPFPPSPTTRLPDASVVSQLPSPPAKDGIAQLEKAREEWLKDSNQGASTSSSKTSPFRTSSTPRLVQSLVEPPSAQPKPLLPGAPPTDVRSIPLLSDVPQLRNYPPAAWWGAAMTDRFIGAGPGAGMSTNIGGYGWVEGGAVDSDDEDDEDEDRDMRVDRKLRTKTAKTKATSGGAGLPKRKNLKGGRAVKGKGAVKNGLFKKKKKGKQKALAAGTGSETGNQKVISSKDEVAITQKDAIATKAKVARKNAKKKRKVSLGKETTNEGAGSKGEDTIKESKGLAPRMEKNVDTLKNIRKVHHKMALWDVASNDPRIAASIAAAEPSTSDEEDDGSILPLKSKSKSKPKPDLFPDSLLSNSAQKAQELEEMARKIPKEAFSSSIAQTAAKMTTDRFSMKMIEHAGFDASHRIPLDVVSNLLEKHILNLGRTFRHFADTHAGHMSGEEILLHTLREGGIDRPAQLEYYVKDSIDRYGVKLSDTLTRLRKARREQKKAGLGSEAYRNREGRVIDDEDLFAREGEAMMLGGMAGELGEDFFGMHDLGLDKELGMEVLRVPVRLFRGEKPGAGDKAKGVAMDGKDKASGEPDPYANLRFRPAPPFVPLTERLIPGSQFITPSAPEQPSAKKGKAAKSSESTSSASKSSLPHDPHKPVRPSPLKNPVPEASPQSQSPQLLSNLPQQTRPSRPPGPHKPTQHDIIGPLLPVFLARLRKPERGLKEDHALGPLKKSSQRPKVPPGGVIPIKVRAPIATAESKGKGKSGDKDAPQKKATIHGGLQTLRKPLVKDKKEGESSQEPAPKTSYPPGAAAGDAKVFLDSKGQPLIKNMNATPARNQWNCSMTSRHSASVAAKAAGIGTKKKKKA